MQFHNMKSNCIPFASTSCLIKFLPYQIFGTRSLNLNINANVFLLVQLGLLSFLKSSVSCSNAPFKNFYLPTIEVFVLLLSLNSLIYKLKRIVILPSCKPFFCIQTSCRYFLPRRQLFHEFSRNFFSQGNSMCKSKRI